MLRRCPHTTPTNMDFRVQSAISDIYPIAREVDFIELFQLLTVLFYSLYRQYTSRTRALCAGGTRFHAHMLPYRRPGSRWPSCSPRRGSSASSGRSRRDWVAPSDRGHAVSSPRRWPTASWTSRTCPGSVPCVKFSAAISTPRRAVNRSRSRHGRRAAEAR